MGAAGAAAPAARGITSVDAAAGALREAQAGPEVAHSAVVLAVPRSSRYSTAQRAVGSSKGRQRRKAELCACAVQGELPACCCADWRTRAVHSVEQPRASSAVCLSVTSACSRTRVSRLADHTVHFLPASRTRTRIGSEPAAAARLERGDDLEFARSFALIWTRARVRSEVNKKGER